MSGPNPNAAMNCTPCQGHFKFVHPRFLDSYLVYPQLFEQQAIFAPRFMDIIKTTSRLILV